MLKIHVYVEMRNDSQREPVVVVKHYVMDHDDPKQRRVLGIQCRNAFEGGQSIRTVPENQPIVRVCGVCKRHDCDDDCEELQAIYRESQREKLRDLDMEELEYECD